MVKFVGIKLKIFRSKMFGLRNVLRNTTRAMKIYTRTGDNGTSALISSLGGLTRRPKSDVIFQTLGDIDELNSHIGSAAAFANHDPLLTVLDDYR